MYKYFSYANFYLKLPNCTPNIKNIVSFYQFILLIVHLESVLSKFQQNGPKKYLKIPQVHINKHHIKTHNALLTSNQYKKERINPSSNNISSINLKNFGSNLDIFKINRKNCLKLNCSSTGVTRDVCYFTGNANSSQGRCSCKENFAGPFCDVCANGYFNYPHCSGDSKPVIITF